MESNACYKPLTGPVGIQGLAPEEQIKYEERIEREKKAELSYITKEGRDAIKIIDERKLARRWRISNLLILDSLLWICGDIPVYHIGSGGPSGRMYTKYYRLSEIKKFEHDYSSIIKKFRGNIFSQLSVFLFGCAGVM